MSLALVALETLLKIKNKLQPIMKDSSHQIGLPVGSPERISSELVKANEKIRKLENAFGQITYAFNTFVSDVVVDSNDIDPDMIRLLIATVIHDKKQIGLSNWIENTIELIEIFRCNIRFIVYYFKF